MCRYPHSLHFLDLLQRKDFRAALCIKGVKVEACRRQKTHTCLDSLAGPCQRVTTCYMQELIDSQQFHFWQHKGAGPPEPQN